MTPRRTRLALCAFLLLAVAVHYNALFRQVRPGMGGSVAGGPAPPRLGQPPLKAAASAVSERPAAAREAPEKGALRVARPNPGAPPAAVANAAPNPDWATTDSTGAAAVSAKPEPARANTIRAIQRELRHRGYGNLPSDGALRPQTRAAIMAYEYDHGFVLTGWASEGLLGRILFGGGPAAEPTTKVGSPEAAELVRFAQQALATLGYQPGPADGQLKAETSRAIREFELDKGLVPKGRISAELIGQLTAPAAGKLTRR